MTNAVTGTDFLDFVQKNLIIQDTKCYRHCENEAKFVPIHETNSSVVGAYVCPGNYASRVIYFADQPNRSWFENFLREQVGTNRLRSRDVRVASRYGWELGGDAEGGIKKVAPGSESIKEYYWVFYPKDESDRKYGTFRCPPDADGCNRLFTKLLADDRKLCPNCSGEEKKID